MILTTVPIRTNAYDRTGAHLAPWINARIASVAAAHPNVRVVDWNAAIQQHPGQFTHDGLHPSTPFGRAWLADQFRDAADDCLRSAHSPL
jgi:hypothetical protein